MDFQRITLIRGDSSHRRDTDGCWQRIEVGATVKLDLDRGDVVGRCASRGLNRFELEPNAAGNVPAKTFNDRLECCITILDTDAMLDSQLPDVGNNIERYRDHLSIGGSFFLCANSKHRKQRGQKRFAWFLVRRPI